MHNTLYRVRYQDPSESEDFSDERACFRVTKEDLMTGEVLDGATEYTLPKAQDALTLLMYQHAFWSL